jgi:hypothetical protein
LQREACYEVGELGEQSEQPVAVEAVTEENDDGEIPWPGFATQRYRQALGAVGARRQGTPFGPVGQLGVAHRRWAMAGEAAANTE